MISEVLGSFILVLIYLTQTEEKYKLSSDAAITLLIISGSYAMAMALSSGYGNHWSVSPLNPAIALSTITFAFFDGTSMDWAWIYLTFSWLGALLAVLMFELGFKKAQDAVQTRQEDEAIEEAVDSEQPMIE
jgi:glycerol uptake facilitator-like aquaporin